VPTGGTTGQALVKVDNTNYNTTWATISGASPGGPDRAVQINNAGVLDGAAELKVVTGAAVNIVLGEGIMAAKNITVGDIMSGGTGNLSIKGPTGFDVNVGVAWWYEPTITLSEHISHNITTPVINVTGGRAVMLAGRVRAGVPPTTWRFTRTRWQA
jgi:hypothetical protein